MDNPPDRTTLRTWFAFGLRLLGFWEILIAVGYFLTSLNMSAGFTKSVTGSTSFASMMTQTVGHLVVAFWLLTGARKIARLIILIHRLETMIPQGRVRILRGRPSN
jgi:hypothetical protein